jgi:uncharacterized membrane protein (UPF0127 family)
MTPTFIDPLVGKRAGRFELVHVESGAVLASHVDAATDAKARHRLLRERASLPDDVALILAPSRALHTFFSRTPLDAVFVSRDGTVVKTAAGIKPRRVAANLESYAVIVAAPGFIERSGTTPGDRIAIREAQAPRPPREILPQRAPEGATPDQDDVEPWDLDETAPRRQEPGILRTGTESGGVRAPAGTGAGSGRPRAFDAVDLERVLARRTPVSWFEAVAVVRELCDEAIATSPADDQRVPDLADIVLTPHGGVELLSEGPVSPAPVSRAARVLLTLLAEAETLPVQLRLLALEEVSPNPKVGTLAEFASRLEFFERPGRRDLVRALYERFQQLPPTAAEVRVAPPTPLAPPPPIAWWRQSRSQVGIGIGALALLLGASIWLSPGSGPSGTIERRGPVARAVASASQKVAQVTGDSIQAVAQWLGLASTDRPTAAAPADAPVVETAGGGASPRRSRVRLPQTAPELGMAATAPDAAAAPPDTIVYTSEDAGVIAPRLDRSRLPANPPFGVSQDEIPQVEVVISATGEVESVKLVTQPARVHAAMMLSAVKNWRFQPALRDGQPVRYRMRLRLTNQ